MTVADVAPRELATLVDRQLGSKGTEAFVTGAQILQQEALERGRQEGRAEGMAKGLEKGLEQGRAEGLRAAIRSVLDRRALPLSAAASATLDACSDLPTLQRWLDDAVLATSADDVLR